MANELRHDDTATGTTLKRSDWEDVDNHRFDSQAQGDMLIASSATQLSRLGITNDRILVSSGGLFSWSNTTPAFTLGGTVTINGKVFDAGSGSAQIKTTASSQGLLIKDSFDGTGGPRVTLWHNTASPAVSDLVGQFVFRGKDSGGNNTDYGRLEVMTVNITDTTEEAKFRIWLLNSGADNLAMSLSSAGRLWVDADIDFSTSIDSALVADHVSLGCFDIAGLRSLAISQESPVVTAAAGASDEWMPVRINGATYKLLLHS